MKITYFHKSTNNWIPKNDKENVNFKKPFNKRLVYIVL